jgi:hypothetical protein
MAREMDFHTLRQQPFPTALPTPGEGGPPAFRAHPGAKSMLLFSGPLRALECAFHDVACRRAPTLGTFLFLSTVASNLDIVILLLLVLVIDVVRLRARA